MNLRSKSLIAFLLLSVSVQFADAAVVNLYSDASDIAGINERFEHDPAENYFVEDVGGQLRVADLSTGDKPEAVWSQSAIMNALRFDVDATQNGFVADSGVDINLRFANPGVSVTSSSNTMATISFEADSKLKANGSTAHTFGAGQESVSVVLNYSTSPLNYTLNGASQTLAPSAVDVFVGGSATPFTKDVTYGSSFDPTLGVGNFGFFGESDSKCCADYLFDNVTLYTGADISTATVPEPSSASMLFAALTAGLCLLRRKK